MKRLKIFKPYSKS